MGAWDNFCQTLKNGVDLETALHQVDVSKDLTCKIINSTWSLINSEVQYFQKWFAKYFNVSD